MSSQDLSQESQSTLSDTEIDIESKSDTSLDRAFEEAYNELFDISSLVNNELTGMREEMEAASLAVEEAMQLQMDIAAGKYDLPPLPLVVAESILLSCVEDDVILKPVEVRRPTGCHRTISEILGTSGNSIYNLPPSNVWKPKSKKKILPSPISSSDGIGSTTSGLRHKKPAAIKPKNFVRMNAVRNKPNPGQAEKCCSGHKLGKTASTKELPVPKPQVTLVMEHEWALPPDFNDPIVKPRSSTGKHGRRLKEKKVIHVSPVRFTFTKVELKPILKKKQGGEGAESKTSSGAKAAVDHGRVKTRKSQPTLPQL